MYIGRIVAAGKTKAGSNTAMYRVSSRSFPNRHIVELDNTLAVVPRPEAEQSIQKNPYIAYNAIRINEDWAVATNGTHTDPIFEKLNAGIAPRDTLAMVLLALDYEKDAYSTPRIATVVPINGEIAWMGIVRHDALLVREVQLLAGKAIYLATYEVNSIDDNLSTEFDASTAADAARYIIEGGVFGTFEHPITGGAALAGSYNFHLGSYNV